MNTKKIPAIVMLLAGAVVCIVTYLQHYEFVEMLKILVVVLIVFLIIGFIIKKIFDSFDIPEDDPVDDDGEVVEKQGEEDVESEDGTAVNRTEEQGE